MAHSTLHFAAGMALGTAVTLPPLLCAWKHKRPLTPHFTRWFLAAYAAGTFAVVPAILRQLGVPDAICDGPWMNVFLLYPWMNAVKPGAVTSGPLALGACLGFQYALLVLAIAWKKGTAHHRFALHTPNGGRGLPAVAGCAEP